LKRTSKKGYTYYACEFVSDCGFMTWDVPVKDDCPECGKTMFKRSGRGYRKPFCINEECPNFLPEDKRGYKRKAAEGGEAGAETAAEKPAAAEKKPAAKSKAPAKSAAKRTAAKKTASPAKKASRAKKTEEKE
jgi:DNA topoisomerase-1